MEDDFMVFQLCVMDVEAMFLSHQVRFIFTVAMKVVTLISASHAAIKRSN